MDLACRVFTGVFEGRFGTGIVYYLSLWYNRTEMGIRAFWFFGPTATEDKWFHHFSMKVSQLIRISALGGLIAFGVGHIHTHMPTWKRLFIIEALPVLLIAIFLCTGCQTDLCPTCASQG